MHSKWVSSLLLLCCAVGGALASAEPQVFQREPAATPTPDSSSNSSSLTAASSTPKAVATSFPANRTQAGASATASSTVSTMVLPSGFINQTLNATMFPANELPLPPEITPAFSVAGVLLMLTGVFYCLIGIKKKWIQISISSAYLISLAITVLIIYIVNPPISNAIQGAYLVGAVAPALLLGGVACIFKDVTEGLGCAVGGFAISMFFLVLKPGGLLTNTASKAIFIGVWTVAIFLFSFSHYTRTYALIGSTSIGGSTAVVLGIDCFSQAGLKEFWVYIWGLNDNLFPLFVQSYPLTRGIRVEIAGIVVFAFFGVLSQLKIWKLVQARKAKKEETKRQNDKERDDLEAELGRQVEEGNDRDRGQWEAIYGDKDQEYDESHPDSGVGTEANSTRKTSMSADRKKQDGEATATATEIEGVPSPMSPFRFNLGPGLQHGVVVQVGDDDTPSQARDLAEPRVPVTVAEGTRGSPVLNQKTSKWTSGFKQTVPSPTFTSFPRQEDNTSTKAAADARTIPSQPSPTESTFQLPVLMESTTKRMSFISGTSMEAMVDQNLLEEFVANPSDIGQTLSYGSQTGKSSTANGAKGAASARSANSSKSSPVIDQDGFEHGSQPSPKLGSFVDGVPREEPAPSAHKTSSAHSASVDGAASQPAATAPGVVKYTPSMQPVDRVAEQSTQPLERRPTLNDISKEEANPIIQQFRTNEWAKHLGLAEAPELDPVKPIERRERASVVDAAALLQTPLTAEPEPINPETTYTPSPPTSPPPAELAVQYTPGGRAIPGRVPSIRLSGAASPPASSNGSSSSITSPRQRPTSSTRRATSAMRGSASPLANTPISENEEMTFHTPRASPLPTDTLLAERGSMLAYKNLTGQIPLQSPPVLTRSASSSTISLNHIGAAQPFGPPMGATLSPPMSPPMSPQHHVAILSDESLPLSARKNHLKFQQAQARLSAPVIPIYSSTSTRTSTYPTPHASVGYLPQQYAQQYTQQMGIPQGPIVTAPAPVARRTSTDPALRQSSMLNAWRASMVAEQRRSVSVESPWTGDAAGAQAVMPGRGPKKVWRDAQTNNGAEGWGSAGEGQRIRQMGAREVDNAHREVLRRMQAGANKKLVMEGQ